MKVFFRKLTMSSKFTGNNLILNFMDTYRNIRMKNLLLIYLILTIYNNCSTIKIQNTEKNRSIKIVLGKIDSFGSGSESTRRIFQDGFFTGLQERGIQWDEFRNGMEIPPPLPFEATSLFLFRSSLAVRESLLTSSEIRNLSLRPDTDYYLQGVLHYFRERSPEELLITLRLYHSSGELLQTLTLTQKVTDYERVHALGIEMSSLLGKGIFP